ncbi:MAG: hypothetical protein RL215_2559 [Planctomycetota bacterium]
MMPSEATVQIHGGDRGDSSVLGASDSAVSLG